MSRKLLGIFLAIVGALLVVGAAWAIGDANSAASSSTEATSTTQGGDDGTSTSGPEGGSPGTSATSPDNSSTTLPGGGDSASTTNGSSSSTTSAASSSTTTPGTGSSTTVDDGGVADGIKTYTVGQAGSVTIEVRNGALILVGVTTNSGWTYEVTKNLPDAIDVHFDKGESEAEIEVDLEDGQLVVVVS